MIKYIDVEKAIKERDKGILKYLPGWIIRILCRIIHQDEINTILNKTGHLKGPEFLKALLEEFQIKVEVEGLENLPENKKCFFAANHPFGFADGLVLTSIVSAKYGTLKAIANDSFRYIPQLDEFVVAVNVFDGSSKAYLKAIEETYGMDVAITHFPAGIVSRKRDGIIQDLPWQKSFITKAVSHKRDIVPFHFHGTNSKLFYRINTIRKIFGIKANIELMLLPHEIFLKRGETIRVTIGKPISWETFDKSKSPYEWAQEVRALTYNLGK
ncbi:MAG: 1-acyl-sn-glycerol-3-phosphate acyltransferase [Bacteroidales bacterium]|jgi:putative hemolysin|nr:1-acyl-sn-glycerol-3-phosphate acyltransferase [Bacteroidales bacterium]